MISAELKKRNDFLYRIKCEYEPCTTPDNALAMRVKSARVLARIAEGRGTVYGEQYDNE